ncbi:calcium-binding protein [Rhodopseudomonas sp. RCAM05734]|uniref:calcium-binding protein n=1 Tax=Rhodopseudomonas sp. RCAM05734 TaxID=3457549 RepID=UPI004044BA10
MIQLSLNDAWSKPMIAPTAPMPPDFAAPAPPEATAAPANNDAKNDADGKAVPPKTASIGQSDVVKSFLLRLQELGLSTVSGTDGNDVLSGWSNSLADAGDGNDTIDVWSGSVVDAGAGNDTVRAWSDSRVHGGDGDDRIDAWSESQVDGGAGNDTIHVWSNSIVSGGSGDDRIDAWSGAQVDGGDGNDVISVWSDSKASGGAGNDSIYAAAGNAIVNGGTGDDLISVGDNSTISFAAGDGKDTVYADRNTRLEFGQGISAAGTHVSVSGQTATITFDGSDDKITMNLHPRGPATLAFADGSTLSVSAEATPTAPLDKLA